MTALTPERRLLSLTPSEFARDMHELIAAGMWDLPPGLVQRTVVYVLQQASPAQLAALRATDLGPLFCSDYQEAREAALHALAHVGHDPSAER